MNRLRRLETPKEVNLRKWLPSELIGALVFTVTIFTPYFADFDRSWKIVFVTLSVLFGYMAVGSIIQLLVLTVGNNKRLRIKLEKRGKDLGSGEA